MKLQNLKMCMSVHITVIQVKLTSHVEFYSLLFHVLMKICEDGWTHIQLYCETISYVHKKNFSSTVM